MSNETFEHRTGWVIAQRTSKGWSAYHNPIKPTRQTAIDDYGREIYRGHKKKGIVKAVPCNIEVFLPTE